MACQYCEAVQKKEGIIYEDELTAAMLHRSPAMPGHILVLPREHFTIIEQVPDAVVRKLAALSNKASTALLKMLGAGGTNIVIENGIGAQQQIPHLAINVIPRIEGDGLSLQWQPKKLSDEQMGMAELQLKEHTKSVSAEPEKKEPIRLDDGKAKGEAIRKSSYLTRQLRRVP
ncbi:HIT family protein [Candidatus Woesearchaeota archaeon]|nr:HIT family protein [Candidatus Woesearchaeota archaeon]